MNSPRPELRLDWCSHAAAKYAVEHWHYSRRMPVGKSVKVGVWEGGEFVGALIFAWGANQHLAGRYGLDMTECAELVRVALTDHVAPVSRIGSIAARMLRRQSPGLRLIVSFADPAHGHHGGIYQAMGWTYSGAVKETRGGFVLPDGTRLMRRAYTGNGFGGVRLPLPPGAVPVRGPGKHRYLYPLDDAMRAQIAPLAKPYPKRAAEPTSVGAGDQPVQGGATPTRPLDEGESE